MKYTRAQEIAHVENRSQEIGAAAIEGAVRRAQVRAEYRARLIAGANPTSARIGAARS